MTAATPVCPLGKGFDFTNPDVLERGMPVAEFAELRRTSPIWWNEQPGLTPIFGDEGFWVVSKHADVREIVKLQLHMLLRKLEEKDIHLIPSEELIAHISSTGFDPQFGARPIKRMIQKELLNELSRQIIAGSLETGRPQVIDVFDGKIVLRKPIDEQEKNGHAGKGKKSKAGV